MGKSCLVTENKFNDIRKISKDFWLVTKCIKTSNYPKSSKHYAIKVECLKSEFRAPTA